jgi:hypothetical protein
MFPIGRQKRKRDSPASEASVDVCITIRVQARFGRPSVLVRWACVCHQESRSQGTLVQGEVALAIHEFCRSLLDKGIHALIPIVQ